LDVLPKETAIGPCPIGSGPVQTVNPKGSNSLLLLCDDLN
jgi:hypothetical protein